MEHHEYEDIDTTEPRATSDASPLNAMYVTEDRRQEQLNHDLGVQMEDDIATDERAESKRSSGRSAGRQAKQSDQSQGQSKSARS